MIYQSIQNQYPATILANMGIPNLQPGVKSRSNGQDITVLTSEEERQIFYGSMKGGHKVFYGKGYTSYGIASAALRLVDIILSDAQEEVAVSSYQAAYQTYLGYPVILGRQGVVAPVHLSLSDEENRLLEESANLIRNRVQEAVAFLREKLY